MHYSGEALKEIEAGYSELRLRYRELAIRVFSFVGRLENEQAREYMLHGVGRRLWLLQRCVDNMFRLFPASRVEKLSDDDRLDLEINLHAFLINTYGIIENIALAVAYENALVGDDCERKLNAKKVSLFSRRFRRLLNPQLHSYLSGQTLGNWYRQYAKNYRDALAHRIPPYVPPAAVNDDEEQRFKNLEREMQAERDPSRIEALQQEQARLGTSNPLFVHSFSEKANFVYLHPQLIADFRTVEEMLNKTIDYFYCGAVVGEEKERGI
jgi:hypothetical protein